MRSLGIQRENKPITLHWISCAKVKITGPNCLFLSIKRSQFESSSLACYCSSVHIYIRVPISSPKKNLYQVRPARWNAWPL